VYRENQHSDSITFLKGINEFLSVLLIFLDRFERKFEVQFQCDAVCSTITNFVKIDVG
jgi:hypothetical protein